MARLVATSPGASAEAEESFDRVSTQLGFVPNMHRMLALSPQALAGYLALAEAAGGALDVGLRARIGIAVAQTTGCDYCLSAQTYIAANAAKLDEVEIAQARIGRSGDARADAIVRFAVSVVEQRGNVADADIARLKTVGLRDQQILEVVAVVGLSLLTNFLNGTAGTDIDWPHVRVGAI